MLVYLSLFPHLAPVQLVKDLGFVVNHLGKDISWMGKLFGSHSIELIRKLINSIPSKVIFMLYIFWNMELDGRFCTVFHSRKDSLRRKQHKHIHRSAPTRESEQKHFRNRLSVGNIFGPSLKGIQ